ncbi:MAG: GMC family oxidoreductase N-terminal domain-containing protein [Pseudomonadota bacterium]
MSGRFDYVIVGGGTAGCVLANRLTSNPKITVALLEAGPPDSDPAIRVPAMVARAIANPRNSWGYKSAPQVHVDGRVMPVPRGRVLGGCSSINGMVYFRGHPREYAQWGMPGWSHADLLPYFKRLENYEAGGGPWRARGGPVNVIDIPKPNPLVKRFLAAAESLGFVRCVDFNGPDPEGFGPRQGAIRKGRRESGVTAYLHAARQRPNLTIVTDAQVTRVVVANGRATGVEYEHQGLQKRADAAREVIVSAGAYGSPHLLQLSGIGDAVQLQSLGITPVLNLPAVGRNLQDHPAASISVRTSNTESYGFSWPTLPRSLWIAAQYLLARSGPLASNVFEANGFMRSRAGVDRPDLQIIFMPAHRNANGHWLPRGHGYGIIFVNLRPLSRGSVTLASTDPHAAPIIDFNFLAQPADIQVLVKGFEVARTLLAAPAFAPLHSTETSPGLQVQDRAQIEAHIRKSLVTVHHPCGTCRMGDVVDTRLRVMGVNGLRVVDASVIPTVIAGNSNIPVNAIAERASDLIIEDQT